MDADDHAILIDAAGLVNGIDTNTLVLPPIALGAIPKNKQAMAPNTKTVRSKRIEKMFLENPGEVVFSMFSLK